MLFDCIDESLIAAASDFDVGLTELFKSSLDIAIHLNSAGSVLKTADLLVLLGSFDEEVKGRILLVEDIA
mgnify:CR=1 FL=1